MPPPPPESPSAACLAAVWVLTPAITALFQEPALSPIVRALSVSFVFQGWSMTAMGLLLRDHRFQGAVHGHDGRVRARLLVVGGRLGPARRGVFGLRRRHLSATPPKRSGNTSWYAIRSGRFCAGNPIMRSAGMVVVSSARTFMDYIGSNLDTSRSAASPAPAYRPVQPGLFLDRHAATLPPDPGVDKCTLLTPESDPGRHTPAQPRRAYLSVLAIMGIILFPACAVIAIAAHELVCRSWPLNGT